MLLSFAISMSNANAMLVSKANRMIMLSHQHSERHVKPKKSLQKFCSKSQQTNSSSIINKEALKRTSEIINWQLLKEKCDTLKNKINTEKYPGLKKPLIATLTAAHIGFATYSMYKFGIDISNDDFGNMLWHGASAAVRVAVAQKLAQEKAGTGTAILSTLCVIPELFKIGDIAMWDGYFGFKGTYGFKSHIVAGLYHTGCASIDATTAKIAITSDTTKKQWEGV